MIRPSEQIEEKSLVMFKSCARITAVCEFLSDSTSSAINRSARLPCKLEVIPTDATDGDLSTPLSE
jgi:hypothetical protein